MRFAAVCLVMLTATAAWCAVVVPVGVAPGVLIAAAGSTTGANRMEFRSDVTILNLGSHDQQVAVRWLPQGTSGAAISPVVLTIPPHTAIRSADFVESLLGRTGLGSIIVSGVTATGAFDAAAQLVVSSRIWSSQQSPSFSATTAQSFDPIALDAVRTHLRAMLLAIGSAANPQNFRSNVGIVNIDPVNAQTFSIAVNTLGVGPPPLAITVTVPPMSMQQVLLGNGFGVPLVPQVTIDNITPAETNSDLWTAYGSTIDNVTGDAWSELAVAGSVPTP